MGPSTAFDIFISYAHIDNKPLVQGKDGWVSIFEGALETRFRQKFGYSPKIYRDKKILRGIDYFDEALIQQLSKIEIFVCVLSERYFESDWCQKEFQHFCTIANTTGGIRIHDKARIIKVQKTPVPLKDQFEELRPLLGYLFYYVDPDNSHPREFSWELNSSSYSTCLNTLDDLIDDIDSVLKVMKPPEVGPDATPGKTIYLAETTYDVRDDRDKIKRELQRRGHIVLPDRQLPAYAPEFETAVREAVNRSDFSVHLIGANYGVIPEAGNESMDRVQHALAAERCATDPSFSRLIWMPLGLQGKQDRQQEFIKYLKTDFEAQQRAELLQTTFEEFKTFILDRLNTKPKPKEEQTLRADKTRLLYLICDQQDLEAVKPIEAYLEEQGYEVILPEFEGDEVQVRDEHRDCLLICDAIIVFYGSANEFWVRTKLRDLKKIAGYGRTKPVLARAIYCAAPETPHKQRFLTHEALLIKEYGSFSASSLHSFLAEMKTTKSAKGGSVS
jgi:TIR domain-containing protein